MAGDRDFEKAFANIAFAELEQKAPTLFQYLIGFQIVEKTDDDLHAVGVFGFNVGDHWYYCPVFWINGRVRGYDLLYAVSYDLFVPLQEKWINYITNKKPTILGEATELTDSQLTRPNFNIFNRSPITKMSSEKEGDAWDNVGTNWRKMIRKPGDPIYADTVEHADLSKSLSKLGAASTITLLSTMRNNEKFAEAVYKFYGPEDVMKYTKETIKQAAAKPPVRHVAGDQQKVKVIYNHNAVGAPGKLNFMTEAEKTKVLTGDAVVRDTRDEVEQSKVYIQRGEDSSIQSPQASGLWRVFTPLPAVTNGSDDVFINGMVIKHPMPFGELDLENSNECIPCNPCGSSKYSKEPKSVTDATVVVDMGSKACTVVSNSAVLASRPMTAVDWKTKFDSLKKAKSLRNGDKAVLVNFHGEGTFPFTVNHTVTKSDGTKILCVDAETGGLYPTYKTPRHSTECQHGECSCTDSCDCYRTSCNGLHICISDKMPRKARNVENNLLIHADEYHIIPLGTNTKKQLDTSLRLGTIDDVEKFYRRHGLSPLALAGDGNEEVSITWINKKAAPMGKGPAIAMLVEQVGVSEQDARILLKKASTSDTTVDVLVKCAFNEPTTTYSYDDNYKSLVQESTPYHEEVEDHPGVDVEDSLTPIDQDSQRRAIDAAGKGQKEIFDLSVLSGLIRTHDINDKIMDWIKDMIIGNDRIGRILFMLYWHYEKFADHYGDEDMVELEDLLIDTFKSNGELILFLAQHSIEPRAISENSVMNIAGIV